MSKLVPLIPIFQSTFEKDFSSWIKNQISRADLDENIDYNLLTLKGEQVSGTKYSIDYILFAIERCKRDMIETPELAEEYKLNKTRIN